MKRSYAATAVLLTLAATVIMQAQIATRTVQAHTSSQISELAGNWNAVCQVENNENTLWVVGDNGKVRKYTVTYPNEAPQLNYQFELNLGEKYKLADVCFPSSTHGYIVGYIDDNTADQWKGRIWYTHTGGASWDTAQSIALPQGILNVPCLSVDFYDNRHGYVGCGLGYVIKTETWGQNWEPVPKQPWKGAAAKIDDIPRHDDPQKGYYNHYGDWLIELNDFLE